ncbi:MAG TPA: methyltransferase [Methylomirabilota bacterium]|jgi:methylene-fatty-acyl-phospholipid synthase
MSLRLLLVAALLLAVERGCYVWIARAPGSFRRWCARPPVARLGEPIAVVRALFIAFKALQATVFVGWCLLLGGGSPTPRDGVAWGLGAVLMLVGQMLSVLVFYRLGRVGIFFGDRLGYEVQWCRAFPFSVLTHPQYIGAVMTIWGFFVITRFPHDDWILLPVLETVYYVAGAYLETDGARWTRRDMEYRAAPSDRSPTRAR